MKSLPFAFAGMLLVPTLMLSREAPTAPQDASSGSSAIVGLTAVYDSLADSILANKRSEARVVRAILSVERDLALAALDRAMAKEGDEQVREVSEAATRMGDFATEGGAAVEPIRNRLLKGGHHHHHNDGSEGPDDFDKGYVVLNRRNKQAALVLAKSCARLAAKGGATRTEVSALKEAFSALAERALKTP